MSAGEEAEVGELEGFALVEACAVGGDCEAGFPGEGEEVDVVFAAGAGGGLGGEVAAAAAEEEVDLGAEGVGYAYELRGDVGFLVAVPDVGGV